ncbi:RNaseH domain-containing protein [Streptomyces kanamyceticus]|uniref:RNaseH domain-containing protein n=1 Tax=Streptomyces kanamyceticus TaxID=1967 RepID=UPI0006E301CD|nr:RNaseH domain-containing protein [Streptomyces kanamyceticus]
MATYDRLQRMSLILRACLDEPLGSYERFEFPQRLARQLRSHVFRRYDADGEEQLHGIPLWAVSHGIAGLLPDGLVTDSSGKPGKTWLAWNRQFGAPRPDKELIVELVRSGLVVAAEERNKKARLRGRPEPVDMGELAAVLADFDADDLRSEVRRLTVKPNQALQGEEYRVLPHLVAAHLVSSNWQVEHVGWKRDAEDGPHLPWRYGTSRWRRVACDEGAELISWPPQTYVSDGGTVYPWSYTLRLTAQNHALGQSPESLLHARVGIRRWARSNVWDGQRAITAYLFTPSPWSNDTSPFGRASLRWQPGPPGKREGKMVWDDVLAATLARCTSQRYLPSAPELAADPQQFLRPAEDVLVSGVVFRDGLGQYAKHSVGTGASARDRWQIFRQLQAALSRMATPEEPLHRLPVPVRPRPPADQLLNIDLAALAQATGRSIVVDVLADTITMRDEVLATLHKALGQPAPTPPGRNAPAPHTYTLRTPHLDVIIRTQPVGELADRLPVDYTIKNPKDRARKAAAERRAQTIARLQSPELTGLPRFAIIEMADAGAYPTPEHDPKEAVKAAAASLGILVQNITPPKSANTDTGKETAATRGQRIGKSVMDLLARQTGLLTHPEKPGTTANPLRDVTTVGLWVLRRNKSVNALLPLAVAHTPDEPFARIRMPHTDTWLPFHQGLLTLSDIDCERWLPDQRIREFFGQVVEEICDGSDIALVSLAQNLRSSCPALTNGLLQPDILAFDAAHPIPPERRKGLRHIRLRTNLRDETAQHYSYTEGAEDGDVGVGSHFWTDPRRPRHFFSTAKKPATAGNGSPQGSRVEAHWGCTGKDDDGNKTYGQKHDTRQNVWNPQLLELLVAAHAPDDDPAAWAALIHQQRYEASHFSDPLALPTVLHLAHTVAKHILPDHLIEPITASET